MVNIKKLDLTKIKINEKKYKNILIYYIGYVTLKGLRYVKINNVNPLHLIINKINGYFEEINGNKNLTLVPTNESKEVMKKYEKPQCKIRYFIWLITNSLDDYDENILKWRFQMVIYLKTTL